MRKSFFSFVSVCIGHFQPFCTAPNYIGPHIIRLETIDDLWTEVEGPDPTLDKSEDGPVEVPDQLVQVGLVGARGEALRSSPVHIIPSYK